MKGYRQSLMVGDMRGKALTDKGAIVGALKHQTFEKRSSRHVAKKYICVGGYVTSLRDGDRHRISCSQLPALYGVRSDECHFIPDMVAEDVTFDSEGRLVGTHKLMGMDSREFVVLFPDPTGRYVLPEVAARA